MLLKHRKRHFTAFIILAIILPVCFIAELVFNPVYGPTNAATLPLFQNEGFALPTTEAAYEPIALEEFIENDLVVVLETGLTPAGELRLALTPSRIQQPDLLVYWQAGAELPETISQDAILLGELSGVATRQFTLPQSAQGQAGYVLIYSNGPQILVAAIPLSEAATAG